MFFAPVQSTFAQPSRASAGLRSLALRWMVAASLGLGGFASAGGAAGALDEVVLKNGRRYVGTITEDSPTTLVLMLDGGTVEFPRSMVASPAYVGPGGDQPATQADTESTPASSGPSISHPLPGIADSLDRLRRFPWATGLKQVPVLVNDQGRWQYLPCISFWVADSFQLGFYGDPARPSAIELSLHHPPADAWEEKRRILEYVLSLAPALAHDNRFDRLDVRGDQYAIGDLWFEVTAPESPKTPGRWTALLVHEISLRNARASSEDLLAISEPLPAAMVDPTRPRSWQRASWLPAELEWVRRLPTATQPPGDAAAAENATNDTSTSLRPLGGERVYLRSFAREGGRYRRTNTDWAHEFAARQ